MANALKSAIVAGVIVLRSPEGNKTFRVPPSTEEYKRVNQRLTDSRPIQKKSTYT